MLNLIDVDLSEQVYVICYRVSRCEFYAPVVWTLASLKANMLCQMAPGETDVHLDLTAGVTTAIRKCVSLPVHLLPYAHCRRPTEWEVHCNCQPQDGEQSESQREQRGSVQLPARGWWTVSHWENREVQCNCQPQDGEQSESQREQRGSVQLPATGWWTVSHRENREVQCNCQPQDGEETQRVTERTERFTAIACSHSITAWWTPPGPTSADCRISDWSNTKWSHLVSKTVMWKPISVLLWTNHTITTACVFVKAKRQQHGYL